MKNFLLALLLIPIIIFLAPGIITMVAAFVVFCAVLFYASAAGMFALLFVLFDIVPK